MFRRPRKRIGGGVKGEELTDGNKKKKKTEEEEGGGIGRYIFGGATVNF